MPFAILAFLVEVPSSPKLRRLDAAARELEREGGRERQRERECKIPLYNLDSESNLDTRSILNPLKHTIHSLCDQAVVQSGTSQS